MCSEEKDFLVVPGHVVRFRGYQEPEWVQGKHLTDAGSWVQNEMTEARAAGEQAKPENSTLCESPRLAQTMNHVGCAPQETFSLESRWIKSKDDYAVLGMFVFD